MPPFGAAPLGPEMRFGGLSVSRSEPSMAQLPPGSTGRRGLIPFARVPPVAGGTGFRIVGYP